MLSALLVITAVLAVVTLMNFIFTMGVVRRLREHSDELARLDVGKRRSDDIGRRVDDFAVETLSGARFARDSLAERTVVAFFMPGCAGCEERLPEFVARMDDARGGDAVIAVVTGDPADSAEMISRLRAVVEVVAAEDADAIAKAFDTRWYPNFYVLDRDGTVLDSDSDIPALAEKVLSGTR